MNAPANHTEIAARFRRALDAVRSGQAIPPADAPWMVGFLDRVLAGANLDEAIGIQTAPGDRKEPHSIDMLERLHGAVERMEHAADRAERAAEQLVYLAKRPGVAPPMLALGEMTIREAANWIGRDPQTLRNWCHDNPHIGKFCDDRWVVCRDELANYFRSRFPDAAAKKFGV